MLAKGEFLPRLKAVGFLRIEFGGKGLLILPAAVADRIRTHPWGSILLPNFHGTYYRNSQTGAVEFRAEMSEARLQEVLHGIQELAAYEEQQERQG